MKRYLITVLTVGMGLRAWAGTVEVRNYSGAAVELQAGTFGVYVAPGASAVLDGVGESASLVNTGATQTLALTLEASKGYLLEVVNEGTNGMVSAQTSEQKNAYEWFAEGFGLCLLFFGFGWIKRIVNQIGKPTPEV